MILRIFDAVIKMCDIFLQQKNIIIAFTLIAAISCDVSHVVQGDGWFKDESGYHYTVPESRFTEQVALDVPAFVPEISQQVMIEVPVYTPEATAPGVSILRIQNADKYKHSH